jgi:hypothetical protein
MRQLKKATKWVLQTFFIIRTKAKCACHEDLYVDSDLNHYCLHCDLENHNITDVIDIPLEVTGIIED